MQRFHLLPKTLLDSLETLCAQMKSPLAAGFVRLHRLLSAAVLLCKALQYNLWVKIRFSYQNSLESIKPHTQHQPSLVPGA